MSGIEIFGAWIAVFLTFAIFSYLYRDNPFYKTAEHIFVGVSAGYWASIYFWTQIQPNLFGRLWPKPEDEIIFGGLTKAWYGLYGLFSSIIPSVFPAGGIDKGHEMNVVLGIPNILYIIPLVLGVMMLMSLIPKFSWFARWGIAYTVGMAAGLRSYGFLNSNVIGQIKGTAMPFVSGMSVMDIFNSLVILVGTITGLLYFYFSREQTGVFGKICRTGIYFLMISFGASFGFAVMGRISLLIGRFTVLITYSSSGYHHATLWLLVIMVILLAIWSFKTPESKEAV